MIILSQSKNIIPLAIVVVIIVVAAAIAYIALTPPKVVEKEVPVVQEVIKEVPVEKQVVKEVVKEVPVEKVVTKEVPAQIQTVRMGYGSLPDLTNIHSVAMAELFMPPQGVIAEKLYFKSGPVSVQALLSGDTDIIHGDFGVVMSALQSGADLKGFAVSAATNAYTLVAKKEITSLKELEGRIFATSAPGDTSDYLPRILLKKEGVDITKVNWKPTGSSSARMTALLTGQIDATVVWPDAAYDLLQKGGGNFQVLAVVGEKIPGFLQSVYTTKSDYIKAHPDIILAITKATIQSARWCLQNRDEFVDKAIYTLRLDPSIDKPKIQQSWEFLAKSGIWDPNGGLTKQNIENTEGYMMEANVLTKKIPAEDYAIFDFQEKALAALGRQ